MATLKTYTFDGMRNTVNKTLPDAKDITGVAVNSLDVMYPVLTLTAKPDFNYCYISGLDKYYFVENYEYLENGFVSVSLSEDVLFTHKDAINAATATATLKTDANKFISNRENVYNTVLKQKVIDFPETPFNEDGNIIMITLKGK